MQTGDPLDLRMNTGFVLVANNRIAFPMPEVPTAVHVFGPLPNGHLSWRFISDCFICASFPFTLHRATLPIRRNPASIGISELAASIKAGRPQFPSHAFTLHLTELALAIQAAGTQSQTHVMETTFDPIDMPEATRQASINYSKYLKPRLRTRLTEQLLDTITGALLR
jgi:hypothetical protein